MPVLHQTVNLNDVTRESSDTYKAVIVCCGTYRAARDSNNRQWLLQRRRSGQKGGKAKWDTIAFCRTSEALMRVWQKHCGTPPPDLEVMLEYFKCTFDFPPRL